MLMAAMMKVFTANNSVFRGMIMLENRTKGLSSS